MSRSITGSILRNLIFISLAVLTVGCANPNAKLVNGKSDGSIYAGGFVSQRVNGDANEVSVWNVWSAEDGLPLANQHCQRYGRSGAEISYKQGITAYYRCRGLTEQVRKEIFSSEQVKAATSAITKCIRANVVVLDDMVSDASTIAQAVAQQCRQRMDEFVDAYISKIPNSGSLNEKYVESLKSNFAEGEKNRVLPYVLGWRRLVNTGWDRQTPPTPKEAPDELFYQAI